MTSACYCALMRAATRRLGAIYDAALAPLGINIAQYSLLRRIRHYQPISLTELGRVAELDRSTVGRNVRVLERANLVTTKSGEKDQREAVVMLADRGAAVLEAAEPVWEQCQRAIEDRLGPDRIGDLHGIMRAL
jgi:DNA-binding MarR family transcriptional regulator